MDYNKVLNELYSMKEWKFKLGLKNMKILLGKLDNPEHKLKIIHVAGTNGKGSVCAMISSILQEAGYKVGMYTSPHLKKFNERIRVNNDLITDKEIVEYYLQVKKHVTNQSFFEITTAMMFLYFSDKKVDYVVMEVGMGGRLDSTNVIIPLISVITNIGYEHTDRLGKKLDKIAFEKAGIIKEGVPTVTGASGLALKTIKKIANNKNSKLIIVNNEIKKFNVGLKGNFQLKNAGIAVKTLEILKSNKKIIINKDNIKNGLKNVKWPGRFQFLEKNVLIDSAHNPEGFKVLFNEVKNLKYNKLNLVVGFSKDKDVDEISKIINSNKRIKMIILTSTDNERAMTTKEAKQYFNTNIIIIKNSKKALDYAKEIKDKDDLILVAGSIYLVGELI